MHDQVEMRFIYLNETRRNKSYCFFLKRVLSTLRLRISQELVLFIYQRSILFKYLPFICIKTNIGRIAIRFCYTFFSVYLLTVLLLPPQFPNAGTHTSNNMLTHVLGVTVFLQISLLSSSLDIVLCRYFQKQCLQQVYQDSAPPKQEFLYDQAIEWRQKVAQNDPKTERPSTSINEKIVAQRNLCRRQFDFD